MLEPQVILMLFAQHVLSVLMLTVRDVPVLRYALSAL